MRRLVLALTLLSLLVLHSQEVRAEDGPDPCIADAAQQALPYLIQSYAVTPSGYGPYGYGPFMQPFGNGPYGQAALFGPPGVSPAFGPLGPGLTANQINQTVLVPGGVRFTDPMNSGTLISLASLQQAELGNLQARYAASARYQWAAATWAGAYAMQGMGAYMAARAQCGQSATPTPAMTMPASAGH